MLDEIFFARFRADAALAAARLVAVGVHRRALDVAGVADGDGHFLVGDQVFELDFLDAVDDLRAALVAVGFLDFAQLRDDHALAASFRWPEFLRSSAMRSRICVKFLEDFVDGELRQAVQLQFENGVDLNVAEARALAPALDRRAMPYFLASSLTPLIVGFALPSMMRDGLVLEELVQILAGIRAAGRSADDVDDVVQ